MKRSHLYRLLDTRSVFSVAGRRNLFGTGTVKIAGHADTRGARHGMTTWEDSNHDNEGITALSRLSCNEIADDGDREGSRDGDTLLINTEENARRRCAIER